MNILITTTLAALLTIPLMTATALAVPIIYGDDNRVEDSETSAARKALGDSVVSLWKSYELEASGSKVKLKTISFTDYIEDSRGLPLCSGEPFREQQTGGFCSGALVGEDLIMTAGHCVKTAEDCQDIKFVFGFAVTTTGGTAPTEVPASDVYSCAKLELVKHESTADPDAEVRTKDLDYAIVRLDRKVTGHKVLAVNPAQNIKAGASLFVIGHPVGLPRKVADGASVRDAGADKLYFTANLDTYGGNSGSAVFSATTGLIDGILVRGDTDFVKNAEGTCYNSNKVANDGGEGESVTKINRSIMALIRPQNTIRPLPIRPVNMQFSTPEAENMQLRF